MNYIGEFVSLTIDRFKSVGAYLTDDNGFDVLLPNKYLTDDMEVGNDITVFIYNDSEDRPVATTEQPSIELNQFAFLRVKATNKFGAFLDWGLEKDLLVPFKEQTAKMVENGTYLVRLVRDEQTNRLIGTAKINKYLNNQRPTFEINEKVSLFIAEETELGRKVIVNNLFTGLIFKNHITQPLTNGEYVDGYIEFVRQDGKLDISLSPVNEEKFDFFTEKIITYLSENGGSMTLTDKSSPETILAALGMSKKAFKKAVGNLYKAKKIVINKDSISSL